MWAQTLNIALGVWLMIAPAVLAYNGRAADNAHIVGPVIASFAIIGLSGCTRSVSKCNIALGAWLVMAPWILSYENTGPVVNDVAVGLLVTVFAFFKRATNKEYGGGWSEIWSKANVNQQTSL